MTEPNINPYFDQKGPASAHEQTALVSTSPAVGDSGMPGWMVLSAPLVGLGLFALVGVFAFTTHEAPPTQGGQHAANTPQAQQQPAAQPQQSQPQNLPQAQQQGTQNPGDPRPGATKPETTGEAPKQ